MGNKFIVKEVKFHEDKLMAVMNKDINKIYVGVSYICKGIGLSKDQKDRQVKNVQSDIVLNRGCVKFDAGVIYPNNEAIALDINFLPLWLAKITITPKMQEEQPKITEKLIQYQLEAKDVLANEFIGKSKFYKNMSKELQAIFVLDEKTQEIENKINTLENKVQEVDKVKEDIIDIKENIPLFTVECKELQALVKKIGTKVLGGYRTPAYNNNSLRGKVYSDIQQQLRREFGVKRYEAIRRCQLNKAREIIESYRVPLVLDSKIVLENRQIGFN